MNNIVRLLLSLICLGISAILIIFPERIFPSTEIYPIDFETPFKEEYNNKVVYGHGTPTALEWVDPLFNIKIEGLGVSRVVERYEQSDNADERFWKKLTEEETQNKTDTVPTYANAIDEVKIGNFTLSEDLSEGLMSKQEPLLITNEMFDKLNIFAKRAFKLHEGTLYFGLSPSNPAVGDMRIRFSYTPIDTVSVLAVQHQNSLLSSTEKMPEIGKAIFGRYSVEELTQDTPIHLNQDNYLLIMQVTGALLLAIGILLGISLFRKKNNNTPEDDSSSLSFNVDEIEKEKSASDNMHSDYTPPPAPPAVDDSKEIAEMAEKHSFSSVENDQLSAIEQLKNEKDDFFEDEEHSFKNEDDVSFEETGPQAQHDELQSDEHETSEGGLNDFNQEFSPFEEPQNTFEPNIDKESYPTTNESTEQDNTLHSQETATMDHEDDLQSIEDIFPSENPTSDDNTTQEPETVSDAISAVKEMVMKDEEPEETEEETSEDSEEDENFTFAPTSQEEAEDADNVYSSEEVEQAETFPAPPPSPEFTSRMAPSTTANEATNLPPLPSENNAKEEVKSEFTEPESNENNPQSTTQANNIGHMPPPPPLPTTSSEKPSAPVSKNEDSIEKESPANNVGHMPPPPPIAAPQSLPVMSTAPEAPTSDTTGNDKSANNAFGHMPPPPPLTPTQNSSSQKENNDDTSGNQEQPSLPPLPPKVENTAALAAEEDDESESGDTPFPEEKTPNNEAEENTSSFTSENKNVKEEDFSAFPEPDYSSDTTGFDLGIPTGDEPFSETETFQPSSSSPDEEDKTA